MLFQHFDFNEKAIVEKFKLDKEAHASTWKHYYSCYSNCLQKGFEQCLKQNYAFNPKARAVMFLIRHNFELCYKYNLDCEKVTVPLSHSFSELEAAFKKVKVPAKFKQVGREIEFDKDGACYRYLQGKDGTPILRTKTRCISPILLRNMRAFHLTTFSCIELQGHLNIKIEGFNGT